MDLHELDVTSKGINKLVEFHEKIRDGLPLDSTELLDMVVLLYVLCPPDQIINLSDQEQIIVREMYEYFYDNKEGMLEWWTMI